MCIRDRFTPADLENLLNEAAIYAARDNRKYITMQDIQNAVSYTHLDVYKRQPQTKKPIEISASKAPRFKAGKALKDAVNE